MKLAFNSKAKYTDFSEGYEIYKKRARFGNELTEKEYKRVVRAYCRGLAEQLKENGIVDLPNDIGSIAACTITRKPQFRGDKFVGYGKIDWSTGQYDGSLKTFGLCFLPKRGKHKNFRCYGFVANRRLFKEMKEIYLSGGCEWYPIQFNDEMI